MVKKLVIAVLIAIGAVLGLALTQPDNFRIERSAEISAPAERIYPLLVDFHRFVEWSPWEHRDPAMKRSFEGAAQGLGAAYAWDGNDEVGQGRMEVIQATPSSRVDLKLDFLRPFEAHNIAEFTLAPSGSGTRVSWAMDGPSPLVSKVMQVFFSMDRMVGGDFEAGLAKLKQVAERQP